MDNKTSSTKYNLHPWNYNQQQIYNAKYTDSDNSEDEGMEDYKLGGYHPVHVGEVFLDRYIVIQKLGWGHFSTVWLAKDMKFDTYVALKVQKSAQHYLDAAYDEVEILQELEKYNFEEEWIESVKHYWKDQPEKTRKGITMSHSQIVQLLNSFIHHGPNGRHFCMVFEIMGVTLLEIIKRYNYQGIPLPYVRTMAKQILVGLDFLHRMCNIIHTDLKPENVLLCLTDKEIREIARNGYLKQNKKKQDNDKENQSEKSITSNKDKDKEENPQIPIEDLKKKKKIDKKKRQKQKKKLAKQLIKQGLNEEQVKKKMNEFNEKGRKKTMDSVNTEEDNKSILSDYSLNDLIEKPKLQSVPKYAYDEITDDFNLEFDIKDYSMKLQNYAKEKTRIQNDEEYKKSIIIRKKRLENIKDENEKNEIIMKSHAEKGQKRGPGLDSNVNVKICDMGNACWFHHHFSTEIQTRQYRSPEVILGLNYGSSADIWSFACMIFELITGDFLFEPRKGDTYSKNDDHMAQIIELLGKMPKKFAIAGRYSKKYFHKNGQLRRIKGLQFWPLKNVLMEKYRFKEHEAQGINDFLLPMLTYEPEKRATAKEMLEHDWFKMPEDFNYKMTEREYEKMTIIKKNRGEKKVYNERDVDESFNEKYLADNESEENTKNESETESEILEPTETINIQNFNNSFAIYGQHVKLSALDKANPQFQ